LTPFETGLYEITLVSPFLCNTSIFYSAVTPDAEEGTRLDDGVWIPNAITLDGDGLNDAWMVYGNRGNWVEFRATVYNRWGEAIFISNDPEIPWIGNDSSGNHFVPNGLYLYEVTLRLTEEIEVRLYHGHINVLR
jgi:gliding motility-associated-like protein